MSILKTIQLLANQFVTVFDEPHTTHLVWTGKFDQYGSF